MLIVKMITIKEDMYYQNKKVLSYKIDYPYFSSGSFDPFVARINMYHKSRAMAYRRYCRGALFRRAKKAYLEAQKNGFPFFGYEAVYASTVTYNMNCTLSTFQDKYEFTGGAHGTTVRVADTWLLKRRIHASLAVLFVPKTNYREYLLRKIREQIRKNPEIYFEDYVQNTAEYFNPESFYLTKEGLVIYYGQYEIAPYSSGIPEFTIPYELPLKQPRC